MTATMAPPKRRRRAPAPPSFPLEPLLAAARCNSYPELAQAAGVTDRTVKRWADQGVPELAADRAAVAVGTLPHLVWPDYESRTVRSAPHRPPGT